MQASAPFPGPGANPLTDDSPEVWERLVEALGPSSMLFCIRERMSSRLRDDLAAEDIWQETLLHVWRDRCRCEWRGLAAFRRWVLSVADRRILNAASGAAAQKRGGGRAPARLDDVDPNSSTPGGLPPPVSSTTPSRVASDLEEADVMRDALNRLAPELRDVVRLRLFEEFSVEEVAASLELGVSAVKHRYRKGAANYRQHIETLLGERTSDGS